MANAGRWGAGVAAALVSDDGVGMRTWIVVDLLLSDEQSGTEATMHTSKVINKHHSVTGNEDCGCA